MQPPLTPPAVDRLGRGLRDLRISVTDRCNLRCSYCMPFEEYEWLAKDKILTFEEIARLVAVFAGLGACKVRLTGGEPLVRRGLPDLVARIASIPGVEDLCLTTNGVLLEGLARPLRDAGLRRVNLSLDTLDPARFERIARRDAHASVLRGLEAARAADLSPLKVNMVVVRGLNDDEIVPMARFCRERGLGLRYIEYMDVGNANGWDFSKVVPAREIVAALRRELPVEPAPRARDSDTAARFTFADGGGDLGVIASVTQPFCGACNRARLTADGRLVTCLFAGDGLDLKSRLRAGASDADLTDLVRSAWTARRDRYSEERLEAIRSGAGFDPKDRHKIEMITLGG